MVGPLSHLGWAEPRRFISCAQTNSSGRLRTRDLSICSQTRHHWTNAFWLDAYDTSNSVLFYWRILVNSPKTILQPGSYKCFVELGKWFFQKEVVITLFKTVFGHIKEKSFNIMHTLYLKLTVWSFMRKRHVSQEHNLHQAVYPYFKSHEKILSTFMRNHKNQIFQIFKFFMFLWAISIVLFFCFLVS